MFIDKPEGRGGDDVRNVQSETGQYGTFDDGNICSVFVVAVLRGSTRFEKEQRKNVKIFLDSENRVHPTRPAVLGRKKMNLFVLHPKRN